MEADKESRQQELRTEWVLNRQDFKFAAEMLGFIPTVDLFASHINTQLEKFMSYRPDPKCIAVDSFAKSWTGLEFYAFPPVICIPRVMQKIWKDKSMGILVTSDWPNQIWYSQLSQLIIKVVLPPRSDLLVLPTRQREEHPLNKILCLRAAMVSGQ